MLENFAACARGEVPKLPYITVAAPSAADPSQAPAGQDVLYIYPPVMPVNPNEGWDALRERVADQVQEQLYGGKPRLTPLWCLEYPWWQQ